jgi:flagellar motility protein MotE (MotC chaperone)
MRPIFPPRLILPSLLFFGVLTVGLRVGAVWDAAVAGKMPPIAARAAETKSDAPPAVTPPAAAGQPAPTPSAAPSPPPVDAAKGPDTKAEDTKPADPAAAQVKAEEDDETSPAEMEVLKQLAHRRDQLDKRGKDLDTREALIKVGEQRVDQKIKEMQSIRLQLQQMVDQINGAQQTQLENLVKIYETMKPADAAKIFESLDMPVLLGVIQRMKPKSTAPILAAMKPEKAKEVTVALTKEDQLPSDKDNKDAGKK